MAPFGLDTRAVPVCACPNRASTGATSAVAMNSRRRITGGVCGGEGAGLVQRSCSLIELIRAHWEHIPPLRPRKCACRCLYGGPFCSYRERIPGNRRTEDVN